MKNKKSFDVVLELAAAKRGSLITEIRKTDGRWSRFRFIIVFDLNKSGLSVKALATRTFVSVLPATCLLVNYRILHEQLLLSG